MKKITLFFAATLLFWSQASAQTASSSHLYTKWGGFLPFQGSAYEHDDVELMNAGLPFSVGLGVSILQPHHKGMFYSLQLDVMSRTDGLAVVRQIPVSLGARYLFQVESGNIFHFYVGGDVLLCRSLITPVSRTSEQAADAIFGYGIGVDCGVIFDIGHSLFAGIDLKSNYIVNSHSDDDFNNPYGVDVSLVFGFCLRGIQVR